MKKILFLIPSLKGGGTERVLCLLSTYFSKKYDVHFLINDDDNIVYQCRGSLHKIDIENKFTNKPKFIRKIYSTTHLLSVIVKYRRKINNISPDISVSFQPSQNVFNVLSSKKSIVSFRSFNLDYKIVNEHFINNFIMSYTVKHARRIIVPSLGIKEHLMSKFHINSSKIEVIPNPINLKSVNEKKEEPLDKTYEEEIFKFPTIINVARLGKEKGQQHLIKAFSKVIKKIPEARLVILGEGPLKTKLINLSKKLGIENSVHFLGFKRNPFKYISRAKIFVLSSLYEGFANVIIESFACGTPVISTDCRSGPREIIAPESKFGENISKAEYGKYGILIPVQIRKSKINTVEEENIMAVEIIKLLRNEELRNTFSKKGLERAKDFDISKIAELYEKVFLDVANN